MIVIALTKEEKEERLAERRKEKWEKTHKLINGIDHKLCNTCDKWYPSTVEYFYMNKANSIDGLHPYCRECAKVKAMGRYEIVRVEDNIRRKQWYEDNKEHTLKRQKKTNEKNKENNKISQSNWRKVHKDKLKEYRIDRLMHKDHDIDDYELSKLYEYCNSSCMYCGLSEEEHLEKYEQKLHKDHAYNLGSDEIDNCVLACKSCNSSKRTKDWDEWYTLDNPKYDEDRYNAIKCWLEIWL